jgi:phosphate starvation-inducible protein PhoH and related proteins
MTKAIGQTGVSHGEFSLDISGADLLSLVGVRDANLVYLEQRSGATLTIKGTSLHVRCPIPVQPVLQDVLGELISRSETEQVVDEISLGYLWEQRVMQGDIEPGFLPESEPILFTSGSRKAVRAKTIGQQKYLESVQGNDVVFAVGPAGTGKTYLAVVMAMDYLKRQLVDRIILVRPAVEAGEQLGFLPGDLQDKINPYLRPLFDALSDITGAEKIAKYLASGVIEASPLAYMRGRTLNNAFVILDEAQNTTVGQMKMFLTRMGFQSKVVVTGDVTQIDLDGRTKSGLVHVREILGETQGVDFVDLDGRDVVRHPLVRRIVDAFEEAGFHDE